MSQPDMNPDNSATEYQEEWLSAYLDNELTEQQRALVEERIANDGAAQQLLEELKQVRSLVSQLPGWDGPSITVSEETLASTNPSGETTQSTQDSSDSNSELDGKLARDLDSEPEDGFADHIDPVVHDSARPDSAKYAPFKTPAATSMSGFQRWRWVALAAGVLVMTGAGIALWQVDPYTMLATANSSGEGTREEPARADTKLAEKSDSASEFESPETMEYSVGQSASSAASEDVQLKSMPQNLPIADGAAVGGIDAEPEKSNNLEMLALPNLPADSPLTRQIAGGYGADNSLELEAGGGFGGGLGANSPLDAGLQMPQEQGLANASGLSNASDPASASDPAIERGNGTSAPDAQRELARPENAGGLRSAPMQAGGRISAEADTNAATRKATRSIVLIARSNAWTEDQAVSALAANQDLMGTRLSTQLNRQRMFARNDLAVEAPVLITQLESGSARKFYTQLMQDFGALQEVPGLVSNSGSEPHFQPQASAPAGQAQSGQMQAHVEERISGDAGSRLPSKRDSTAEAPSASSNDRMDSQDFNSGVIALFVSLEEAEQILKLKSTFANRSSSGQSRMWLLPKSQNQGPKNPQDPVILFLNRAAD